MWATYRTSPLVVMMATVASPGYACTMRSRQPMTRASSSSVCRSVIWLTPLARVQHPSIAGQQRREGGDASWLAAGAGYLQIVHEPKHQFIWFDHALQPLVLHSGFPPDPWKIVDRPRIRFIASRRNAVWPLPAALSAGPSPVGCGLTELSSHHGGMGPAPGEREGWGRSRTRHEPFRVCSTGDLPAPTGPMKC